MHIFQRSFAPIYLYRFAIGNSDIAILTSLLGIWVHDGCPKSRVRK